MASRNLVCISKAEQVKRVRRRDVQSFLDNGWNFEKRARWKKEVRDVKGYVAPTYEQPKQGKKKVTKNKQKEKTTT